MSHTLYFASLFLLLITERLRFFLFCRINISLPNKFIILTNIRGIAFPLWREEHFDIHSFRLLSAMSTFTFRVFITTVQSSFSIPFFFFFFFFFLPFFFFFKFLTDQDIYIIHSAFDRESDPCASFQNSSISTTPTFFLLLCC